MNYPLIHRSIVYFLQVLYEFIFCNSEICCAFGIYTTFPRVLVNIEEVRPIEHLQNSLAIEMDDNLPDPLISLEFSVRLTCHLMLYHFRILWFVFATANSFVLVLQLL